MNMKSVFLFLVFGFAGCGTDDTAQDPSAMGETPVIDANVNSSTLSPVASLHLSNGNTVGFYDGGKGGILITELGKARTTPALKGIDVQTLGAVNTWNILSHAAPAPQALIELQERVDAHAPAEGSASDVDRPIDSPTNNGGSLEASPLSPHQGASAPEQRSAVQGAANACNNGCCDPNWIVNDLCPLYADHSWLHFDVGWSWEQDNGITDMSEVVCAATGTSRFGVHRGNDLFTFNVPEGYYQTYWWDDGACILGCGSDNHSVVNTNSANQPVSPTNMHTFCGTVFY